MRTVAIVYVGLQRPIETDSIRRWKDAGVSSGSNLHMVSVNSYVRTTIIKTELTKLQKTLSPAFTLTGRPPSSMVIAVVASRYEPKVPAHERHISIGFRSQSS